MIRKIPMTMLIWIVTLTAFAGTTCTITGTVINRDSKVILLRKYSENFKVYFENPIKIKIKNGMFNHTFSYTEMEAYELVFEDELKANAIKAIIFFPDKDTVHFQLFPKAEWNKNELTGGNLNLEYENYLDANRSLFEKRGQEIAKVEDALMKSDSYNSPEYNELRQQLRATKSDDYDAKVPIYDKMDEMQKTHTRYTEEAKRLVIDRYDSLSHSELVWKYKYIEKNISLVSYYLIWNDVEMQMKTNAQVAQLVTTTFPAFEKKYPEHIYTKKISAQLSGLQSIVVGKRYIDFKAPTIDGDTIRLSEIVNNQVTLVDFWGSWCGPCIAKSRLVVPIYEKYKDKGFEVVGIAREFKNTDAMKKRLAKEQFSWLHLVELDDKQNIWNIYGINNGTGMMVLVDKDGIILAIDPAPEDLEKMIQKNL